MWLSFSHGSVVSTAQRASNSLHQVDLASLQPPIDQTSLTPSAVSQKLLTCLLAPHPLPTLPIISAPKCVVPPPTTSSYFLPMTQLPLAPTSNYQPSTPTDHRTTMHRQQNPPKVPMIEPGATRRTGKRYLMGER